VEKTRVIRVSEAFFHCFSRRREPDGFSREFSVLEGILSAGLLLVPEVVVLPGEFFGAGKRGRSIQFIQRRFSLTLLTEDKLQPHCARFGPFAVELTPSSARALGAIPVIYLPQPTPGVHESVLDSIGSTLLYRLREIFFVLADLSTLSSQVHGALDDDVVNLQAPTGPARQVSARATKNILEMLESNKQPFADLAASVQALMHLFYPTDKSLRDTDDFLLNLFYYQQKEWRIFSDVLIGLSRQERPLSTSEKGQLIEQDAFFAEIIDTIDPINNSTVPRPRCDLCKILERVDGRPVFSYFDRIWVPEMAVERATKLIRGYGCSADVRPHRFHKPNVVAGSRM
jgi:hypothetical protein